MHRSRRPRGGIVPTLAVLLVASLALLSACGGDGGTSASKVSEERPASESSEAAGSRAQAASGDATEDFCAALRALAEDQEEDVDAEELLEAMERMRDAAPDELSDEADALVRFAQRMVDLDLEDDDPEAFGKMLELVMDPEVMAATSTIEQYSIEQCGFDMSSGGDVDRPDVPDAAVPGGDDADIHLEDIEPVQSQEQAAGATWPGKISGRSIMMGRDVSLIADEAAGLTAAEALAACTAVRAALVQQNPAISVEVRSGDQVLAAAPSGGECASR